MNRLRDSPKLGFFAYGFDEKSIFACEEKSIFVCEETLDFNRDNNIICRTNRLTANVNKNKNKNANRVQPNPYRNCMELRPSATSVPNLSLHAAAAAGLAWLIRTYSRFVVQQISFAAASDVVRQTSTAAASGVFNILKNRESHYCRTRGRRGARARQRDRTGRSPGDSVCT